ncbi:MAG: hypothetical protein U0625_03125 [Phycisphaerales bacterium]
MRIHAPPGTPRAATTAALVLGAALAAAGCQQRTVVAEHYDIGPPPDPSGVRTVIVDESGKRDAPREGTLAPLTRMRFDGRTFPVPSPDGTRLAVQTATTADWALMVGDPLPPQGLASRIESVSLDPQAPGTPLATLEGAWLLGRAATAEGYLVERPRADGTREIAIAGWNGAAPRPVVADEWTNAFATAFPDGSLAWCRRPPEGGDWQLVIDRGGRRRVLAGEPGQSWLMPVFAGDGTGLFALRLEVPSLVVAWIPFGRDGLPPENALRGPLGVEVLSLRANLTLAVRTMLPVGGMSASPLGRERIALWLPERGRMALWAPGGTLELLAEGTAAATPLDAANVLVTTPALLGRQRLGPRELPVRQLTDGAWITRPTITDQMQLLAMRTTGNQLEVARLTINPEAAQADAGLPPPTTPAAAAPKPAAAAGKPAPAKAGGAKPASSGAKPAPAGAKPATGPTPAPGRNPSQ